MIDRLIGVLEVHLGHGLRLDARRLRQTEASARVLLAFEAGEALPMARVAERLGREPSTATRFVDRAEADGLVVRVAAEADHRSRLARLTPKGEDLRAELLGLRTTRGNSLVAAVESRTGLGADQVQWFLQALSEAASR
jgi:DNA-binding MarR family transcriptional regulator